MTRRRLAGIAALATPLALAAAALAAPPTGWPGWRGPNRDGLSTETGLLRAWPASGPTLAWKASGLGSGFSSVSVGDGRVYTMGDVGGAQHVIALSAADGKKLWSAKIGAPWEDQYAGPRGTPTLDGDMVYAIGTEGTLVALEAATGKERWRKSLPGDFGGQMMSMWTWSESPLVDGDRVVVTPGGSGALLVALDKRTGKEIWRTAAGNLGPKGKDGAAYSSIVISNGAGVKQYVQLTGRGVVGVRASDGKLLWSYNRVANDVANIPTPVVKGDLVFTSTGYQTGAALLKLAPAAGGVTATEVYFLDGKTFQNHHGGMVLVGDHIYAGHGHNRGNPIAIELATGKVVWGGAEQKAAGTGSAAVAYADGSLYFRYQNGTMALIEATPTGYVEKGTFAIPGVTQPSWPHPVIVGGRLYIREQDALLVYDVKKG